MDYAPRELVLGGIYFPPLLLAAILGVLAAWVTAAALNRVRLSRFFHAPPVIFIALAVIYTCLIGSYVVEV